MGRKFKVFIAAPLFNDMERERNSKIKAHIESLGYSTFLAQDDVGLSYDLIKNPNKKYLIRKKIFKADVDGVKKCDVVLFLLDGRTPDEGACIEVGMGWMLNKPCIAFKSDNRAMDQNGDNNIMIDGCLNFAKPVGKFEELEKILSNICRKIKK